MEIKIKSKDVPSSEYSFQFLQGMLDRMGLSYYKYGKIVDAYPHKINAIESMKVRVDKYLDTGNIEFLIDAANFAMIEFMLPSHPEAFYKATTSDESPGRAAYDTHFETTDKTNNELSDNEFKEIRSLRKKHEENL